MNSDSLDCGLSVVLVGRVCRFGLRVWTALLWPPRSFLLLWGCCWCLWLMRFPWFSPLWELNFCPQCFLQMPPFSCLGVSSSVSDLWINFTLISRPVVHLMVFCCHLRVFRAEWEGLLCVLTRRVNWSPPPTAWLGASGSSGKAPGQG